MSLSVIMSLLLPCAAFALDPPACSSDGALGNCAFRASSMLQGVNASGVKFHGHEEVDDNWLVLPLQRVKASGNAEDTPSFYIGHITVGYPPQRMRMLFDTSTGNVILPHKSCKDHACQAHRRYASGISNTAESIFRNGTRISKLERVLKGPHLRETAILEYEVADVGEGKVVSIEVRDRICLPDAKRIKICATSGILAAIREEDVPFKHMPNDGILGLALGGLSLSPTFNFLERLLADRPLLKPQFGISLGRETGEFHIGGYNPKVLGGPLKWFPVHAPEEGFWQVPIFAVRVGGVVVDDCLGGCHAILDTGSSRLGVQKTHLPALETALASAVKESSRDGSICQGPDLSFDLGTMQVVLGADDYTDGRSCEPHVGSLNLSEPEYQGVYTFGEMVLRHYFVVFDWKAQSIGFAPADGYELERNRPKIELAWV